MRCVWSYTLLIGYFIPSTFGVFSPPYIGSFRPTPTARTTDNYNPDFNYGVYQITKELNTYTEVGAGKVKKRVYDYPVLNGHLDTLRVKLKDYYKSHITEKMFEYELLK